MLTLEKQIKFLAEKHHLIINDLAFAKEILSRVSYYRLRSYGKGLTIAENNEVCRPGITFEHVFDLYCFDSQLRGNLFRALEQLEIQLRAQIGYLLGTTYGPTGYLNKKNFADNKNKHRQSIHGKLLSEIKYFLRRNQQADGIEQPDTAALRKYPIGLVIESMTFGQLNSLYSILKPVDKRKIAALYHTNPTYFESWFPLIVDARNKCAHYERIYNRTFSTIPRLYKEYAVYVNTPPRLFSVLLTIKRMFRDNPQWVSLYKDVKVTITKFQHVVDLPLMGFPENWEEVLTSQAYPLTTRQDQ